MHWGLKAKGKQLQDQAVPQSRPGQEQRDTGSHGPVGDTWPDRQAPTRPSAWAEGRKGLVDARCGKPSLQESTPSLLFPPLPSSSPFLARGSALWGERDAIAGKGSPGLLKSIFRGEQGRLGGRDVDILWPSGHRSRPFSLQTDTSLFKPMPFYTGSGSLLGTGCWTLRGKATICIL